jgi:23S rRNA pseudouridine955/2504/2580 synthase
MAQRTYVAAVDDNGRRLDRVARRLFPGEPLGRIFRAIRTGAVLLNGRRASPGARVAAGDEISAAGLEPGRTPRPQPSALPLSVLFENEHVLAIDKPQGMPVHGPDSAERLVAARLQGRRASLSFSPGPAHRLDRGTSGLLLFSCSLAGAQELTRLFRERLVTKEYLAIVEGPVRDEQTWEDSIDYDHDTRRAQAGEQAAVTRIVPLASGGDHTLLACFPLTGRTHQIRAQAALHGHPLAGDAKYGGRPGGGYLLHSLALRLGDGADLLGFERLAAPLPGQFLDAAAALMGPQAAAAATAEARARLSEAT